MKKVVQMGHSLNNLHGGKKWNLSETEPGFQLESETYNYAYFRLKKCLRLKNGNLIECWVVWWNYWKFAWKVADYVSELRTVILDSGL